MVKEREIIEKIQKMWYINQYNTVFIEYFKKLNQFMIKRFSIISFILLISLFFFITDCTVNKLYTKDEFMALGDEESKDSDKIIENTELKEAQLVDPAIDDYGSYTFSTVNIRKSNGELMFDGIDFDYDQPLNAIYNIADNGALSSGYFRIVHDGVNIINGLGLTPIAKDLTTPVSPPSDQIYIDPENGRFILPRPIYWSKCEGIQNMVSNCEINFTNGEFSLISYLYFISLKFNLGMKALVPEGSLLAYYPFGQGYSGIEKGIISFWLRYEQNDGRRPEVKVYFNSNTYTRIVWDGLSPSNQLYVNGIYQSGDISHSFNTWVHVYIVWDNSCGLSGSKTVKVFFNNSEVLSSSEIFAVDRLYLTFACVSGADKAANMLFDNLKIWNHVVSENPSWEYNNGDGIEEALHIIYGQTSEYNPGNIQVGYFYK